MCYECGKENDKIIQTKVCKICGEEKPLNEFGYHGNDQYDSYCKVCGWIKRKKYIYENYEFKYEEDLVILDCILNKKIKYINELEIKINKSLHEICFRINKVLRVGGNIKLSVFQVCPICKKEFIIRPCDILMNKNNCCSKTCGDKLKKGKNIHTVIGKGNCKMCGVEFDIISNVPNQKFCSSTCKSKYYCKQELNKEITHCSNCNKEVLKLKSQIKKYKNAFCSLECELEHKHKEKYEYRKCELCGIEFEVLKSSTQRFCNTQCQINWQRQYPKVGLNNKNFKSILIKCDWCNKEYYEKPYRLNSQQYHFCCKECRIDWYAKEFSQSDEWKKECAERATNMISNGVFGKTDTNIQIIINKVLDELNIRYDNEFNCKYVSIDNAIYVKDKMFFIECMGTYWHCDNREYQIINYVMQKERIKLDKIKHSYIRDNYDIEILYLWEKDIIENLDLCKTLIKQYIEHEGELENYHSMNYVLRGEKITLIKNKHIPYMDWQIDDLNKIISIDVKEKSCKKQIDKWTQYKCEMCEKNCEELTSHFIKKKHHFCSTKCSSQFHSKKVKVKCDNCNNELEVIESKFNKNKHFFCNQKCQHEFQKNIGFKKWGNTTSFKCDCCGKDSIQKTSDYNKSKHHFCSKECNAKYKTSKGKGRTMVEFECDNCGKITRRKLGDYNKVKQHFCCYDCSVEFRRNKYK